jgi:hypothetical protein
MRAGVVNSSVVKENQAPENQLSGKRYCGILFGILFATGVGTDT